MNVDEVIQQPGQEERILKESFFESLHVAVPGQIVSYDSTKRTADIQPLIRNWRRLENSPLLLDVPVFFPGNFTFTVSPGDECLVVFADSCIDAWFQNSGISSPIVSRRHDMSDGFAFVGFFSAKRATGGVDLGAKLKDLEDRIIALEGGGSE